MEPVEFIFTALWALWWSTEWQRLASKTWHQIMSGQGDDIQCHINVEGQLINRWTLTYRNDTGLFDKKTQKRHPCDLPKLWKDIKSQDKRISRWSSNVPLITRKGQIGWLGLFLALIWNPRIKHIGWDRLCGLKGSSQSMEGRRKTHIPKGNRMGLSSGCELRSPHIGPSVSDSIAPGIE